MATSRSLREVAVMSSPSTRTRPALGASSPARMRSVVDLPEPEGPSRAKNSPGSITRSRPFSAATAPWLLRISSKLDLPAPVTAVLHPSRRRP